MERGQERGFNPLDIGRPEIYFQPRFKRYLAGFTLIELLIYSAIFSVVSIIFISILITITRLQIRQSGASAVNSEAQFLIQKMQQNISKAAAIDMPQDTATTTITLRTDSTVTDPTTIFASGTTIWIKQGSAAASQLTSDRVSINNPSFVRRINPGGRDMVNVNFGVSYNTNALQQQYSIAIDISIARLGPVKLGADLSCSGSCVIGANAGEWASINNTIFFDTAGNVGFGNAPFDPRAKVQINKGDLEIHTGSSYYLKVPYSSGCYLYSVDGSGNLTRSTSTCP